ncbi:protein of unknown function [Taphrina deformans PYCC 5710]|uniref:Glycosyltransferase family 31 protein n=1 Tax=Taphrina deformans (strain PYCC 5710 / ATCC 11124 / CBS 356.35 / IMI 108563 / JCM 9778 / NBRC 8474) TaxID=1097556 RepID=R4XF86_TAPDE|nr:protein of unknown function [Taphrina deformans PYCC 5710]|eukprot:CCG84537.1 protein of unknown function [Taphrina deformans PYCC 5710]
MFFSLATRADRIAFENSITSSYLNGSGAHLLLTLPHDDNPSGEFLAESYLAKLGLSSFHVVRATRDVSFEESWASSIPMMHKLSLAFSEPVKYFIALDDDTLITSMVNYRHLLDKYPPSERHMIGARSEDIQRYGWGHGLGPYGGASIALTHKLVEDMVEIWDECRPLRDSQQHGDHKLDYCYNYLQGTPLRSGASDQVMSLHQLDLSGLAGPYFQSGQQWLTVHHFGWFEMFPKSRSDPEEIALIKLASKTLDGENIFQNYLLRHNVNETVILTTAYSLVTYRPPLEAKHLGLLERLDHALTGKGTWHDLEVGQGPYRPVREENKDKWTRYIQSITPRLSPHSTFSKSKVIGYTMRFSREFGNDNSTTEVDWLL